MQCNCGGRITGKTITKDGLIVTHYQQCETCTRLFILSDLTGKAVKRAYAHNLKVFK